MYGFGTSVFLSIGTRFSACDWISLLLMRHQIYGIVKDARGIYNFFISVVFSSRIFNAKLFEFEQRSLAGVRERETFVILGSPRPGPKF